MKNLYDATNAAEITNRIARLTPTNERQWGKMNLAQAIAHCSLAMQMATDDLRPPRVFLGYIIGGLIKPMVFRDDTPLRRNAPTARELVVDDRRELEAEKARLIELVTRFASSGPARCTQHPHAFFGRLTPDQWAILTYKHTDHHLRQFNA